MSNFGKRCSKCRQVKPKDEFYKDNSRKDGRCCRCKICATAYAKEYHRRPEVKKREKAYSKGYHYRPEIKRRQQSYALQRTFGITIVDKETLFDIQNGSCAICKRKLNEISKAHIDHDHKTDKIRGLLCHNCNTALGMLRDDTGILYEAIKYLDKHSSFKRCTEHEHCH
jgi:hypothetical protein